MKRFLTILLATVLLFANFAFAEKTGFDYKVLSELDGYEYDKFDKTWLYYCAYRQEYTNATVVIGIQALGNASSVEHIDIYAWIRDEYNKEVFRDVTQLMILADDQLITCNMYVSKTQSGTYIGPASKDVLRIIGEAQELSFKLIFKTGSITLDPSAEDVAELVSAAKNIYKYNLVDFISDLKFIELIEKEYPITIE